MRLIVSLPNDLVSSDHLLELRYQLDAHMVGKTVGYRSIFPGSTTMCGFGAPDWQLVVPEDETLVSESGDLTAEFNWAWDDHGFGFDAFP